MGNLLTSHSYLRPSVVFNYINNPEEMISSATRINELIAMHREGYALPRAFYHDRILYEFELDTIWRNSWIFAGFTCQIPKPGDFLKPKNQGLFRKFVNTTWMLLFVGISANCQHSGE